MSQLAPTTSSDPKIWGPVLWKFLHIMAHNYPEHPTPQTKASSRQFFFSLRHLLPCEICRIHYSEFLAKRQPETDSAEALQEWLLSLHNEVSARTNPNSIPWTLNQLNETLRNCSTDPPKKLTFDNTRETKQAVNNHIIPDIQFSPRSKDRPHALFAAQQMHKKLSASRQRQSSMSKIDNVGNVGNVGKTNDTNELDKTSETQQAPPFVIRQDGIESYLGQTQKQSKIKSDSRIHRMYTKSEVIHNPYNSFNRKSMMPRNGRNLPVSQRKILQNSIRGKPKSSVSSIPSPTFAKSETSSGTKKTCGCKNK